VRGYRTGEAAESGEPLSSLHGKAEPDHTGERRSRGAVEQFEVRQSLSALESGGAAGTVEEFTPSGRALAHWRSGGPAGTLSSLHGQVEPYRRS
jgi:hypothetical protein